jgi:isocitrate/isopropylmalate dehydrogenase
MSNVTPVTVAHGEGIGPEIMAASLHIIQEAGARIQIENIEIGEKVYLRGNTAGMSETLCTDSYRCRFTSNNGTSAKETLALLNRVLDQSIDIVKTESLRAYDGKLGYTLAQGQ